MSINIYIPFLLAIRMLEYDPINWYRLEMCI